MKKSFLLHLCNTPLYVRVPENWDCEGELKKNGVGFLSMELVGDALMHGLVRTMHCGKEYAGYLTEVVDDDFEGCP